MKILIIFFNICIFTFNLFSQTTLRIDPRSTLSVVKYLDLNNHVGYDYYNYYQIGMVDNVPGGSLDDVYRSQYSFDISIPTNAIIKQVTLNYTAGVIPINLN